MATLVFSAIGSLLGGPFGGALGAFAGRQIDALLFAPPAREGPRLAELTLSASSYGLAVPRQHGRVRTGGQVIWATDLIEAKNRQGNGKGRPATVTYSYSASFAVALSSRPIEGIGRIWADGKLLRGAAGDLKVGGILRVHAGHCDQPADPLLAAAEGGQCPAHRGLAYVVFEDLQLAEYGNRIPALSFEVFADAAPLSLQSMLDPVIPDCDAEVVLNGLDGLTIEGSAADLLALLDPLFPLDCDACDAQLTVRPERNQTAPVPLPEPAIASSSDDFGSKAGFARNRALGSEPPLSVLRHYDPDRDYQPGVQRASGPPAPGQPRVLELPATIAAPAARRLVDAAARQHAWARHTLAWRVTQLDPAIRPGTIVTLPGEAGQWRVKTWEWRTEGVEFKLERIAPAAPDPSGASDPGRVGSDPDLPPVPTRLVAFELPWDGNPATPLPQLYAATAGGPGWTGASLLVDQGDGAWLPLGTSGRSGAVLGTTLDALAAASPLLFDRTGSVTVTLVDPAAALGNATLRQLAQGANKALIGNELVQFAMADPLGAQQWRLSGLLRGRGGTEAAISAHLAGEPFVLLDSPLSQLDPVVLGPAEQAVVGALGLGDPVPATSTVHLAGIGWRPLSPVHGEAVALPGGGLDLRWTRRARGGWRWDDGVDLQLNEQREAYAVEFGMPDGSPLARWDCNAPQLALTASEWSALAAAAPSGVFAVRQVGDRAVSLPLVIAPV